MSAPLPPTESERRFAALRAEPSTDAPADPARLARVERTRGEMLTQGAAVRATLAAEGGALAALARHAAARQPRRMVIAGCGDSWWVGVGVRDALARATGLPVEAAEAYDFARYEADRADAATLVLGLSASGTTPAVREALERARAAGAFAIGVANAGARGVLPALDGALHVHALRRGWPTQSSTAAMALLVAWGIALARAGIGSEPAADALGRGLGRAADLLDAWTPRLDAPMAEVGRRLAAVELMPFAGAGPNHATAGFGAAKIRELAPIHAFATPMEELQHYRAQKPGDPLILIAPDGRDRERALDAAIVGHFVGGRTVALLAEEDPAIAAHVERVVLLPAIEPELAPIVHSIAVHHLAYHFARARAALGLGHRAAAPS